MLGDAASCIAVLLMGFIIWLLKQAQNAPSKYFEEKAANLATKQDIAEITRKTEEVQTEFKREFSLFEQDIEYRHKLYETQMNELYSKLFYLICKSEALRYVEIRMENETDFAFERVPIAELENEESIIGSIIDSIETNTAYASPKLNRLSTIYTFANDCKTTESKDASDRIVLDAKKEIVKTIIDDYIDLRKKLKLECEFDIRGVTGTVFEVLELQQRT